MAEDNENSKWDIFGVALITPYISMGVTPMGNVQYSIEIDGDSFVRGFRDSKVMLNNKVCIGKANTSVEFAKVIYKYIKQNNNET